MKTFRVYLRQKFYREVSFLVEAEDSKDAEDKVDNNLNNYEEGAEYGSYVFDDWDVHLAKQTEEVS